MNHLSKWGLGILAKSQEVARPELTGLRSSRDAVHGAAVKIVSRGRRVAGSIGLTRNLSPVKSVNDIEPSESGVGGRSDSEAGSLDVAPIAARRSGVGHSVARSIDDEALSADSGRSESLVQEVDVVNFVNGLVVLALEVAGVVCARGGAEGLIIGGVGGKSSDKIGSSGCS
jgi:hypothetical protein